MQQAAYNKLRAQFLSAPILIQCDRTLKIIMKTDIRNQGIAGILSQFYIINKFKQHHPVAYYASTHSATQYTWPIPNYEPLAVVDCFWKWRAWLQVVDVTMATDYTGL